MAGINDIADTQRDLARVQRDIKDALAKYKKSDDDQKQKYIDRLKDLNEKKKSLDATLEDLIMGMHTDAEIEGDEDDDLGIDLSDDDINI